MGTLNDAIVVGGGPAGCAAAIGLARAGRTVVLLERERATGAKVCGEFLSVEACEEARALGVDPAALGAAPIDTVRVTWGRASVETALPFRAASLSRRRFDEAFLTAAAGAGARVERGTRALAIDGDHVRTRGGSDDAAASHRARAIVLASGKNELAGFHREGGHFPDALGFKMHLELEPAQLDALGTAVELTLFAGGYAGMQRIEDARVAFALAIRKDAYARLGSWPALIRAIAVSSPRLARRLEHARELWPKPLAISGVPYGYTYRDDARAGGPYRAGDQLAVIPSFTGDGMAIALVTGSYAARAIVAGESPAVYHAAMRARLAGPMRVAGALSRAIGSAPGRAAVVWPAMIAPQIFAAVAKRTRIAR